MRRRKTNSRLNESALELDPPKRYFCVFLLDSVRKGQFNVKKTKENCPLKKILRQITQ